MGLTTKKVFEKRRPNLRKSKLILKILTFDFFGFQEEVDSVNEISDVANFLEISEYNVISDVLKHSGVLNEDGLDKIFARYITHGEIPPLVRQVCRNYLKDIGY